MVSAIQQAFRATSTNKAGYLPASSASVAQRRLIRLQHTFFA